MLVGSSSECALLHSVHIVYTDIYREKSQVFFSGFAHCPPGLISDRVTPSESDTRDSSDLPRVLKGPDFIVYMVDARSALAGRQLAREASGQLSRQDRCRGRPRQAGSLGHRPSRAPATGGVRRLPARQARHATGEVLTDAVHIYGCNGHG